MGTTFHAINISAQVGSLIDLTISLPLPGDTVPPNPPVPTDPNLNVSCSKIVTVSCILQLYNAASYQTVATNKNSIGITGYLGQFANNADLQLFYKKEVPAAQNSTFTTVLVNGACPMYTRSVLSWHLCCGCNLQADKTAKTPQMPALKPIWTPSSALVSRSRRPERSSRPAVVQQCSNRMP